MNFKLRLGLIVLWLGLLCMPACQPEVALLPLISIDNAANLDAVGEITFQDPVAVVWALDGKSFWVASFNSLARYNNQTLEEEFTFPVDEPGVLLDASPDGTSIAYTPEKNESFQIYNSQSDATLVVECDEPYGNVKFSPDGKEAVSTSMNEWKVSIWDTSTGKLMRTLEGFETAAPVYSAQIGEDGKTLIWFSRGTLQLQDMTSGTMGAEFGHQDWISAFALSPNGEVFATAAYADMNGEYTPVLYVWDAHSGDLLYPLGYTDTIQSLSFSPDGKLLSIASGNQVTILKVETRKSITLPALSANVYCARFSADGRSLLTCGDDDRVRLWQVIHS